MKNKLRPIQEKLKKFFSNRTNVILVVVLVLILLGAFFGVRKFLMKPAIHAPLQEVDLPFDADGPYALLLPRRDGNALNLNITRVSSYDAISYEMAYSSSPGDDANVSGDGAAQEGMSIDRGVQGSLNTNNKKNEYSQEILFGTCSKGDTFSTLHCVFDKNVENGTLVLKIQKGDILYKINTTWHLQKPDLALGVITSGDNHFTYTTKASREDLAVIGYTIVNDLSGMPKLPEGKTYVGKVYALNVPTAKTFPAGEVKIELAQNPPAGAQIGRFDQAKNEWLMLDTKINGSTLTAQGTGDGIYAVFTVAPSGS